MDAIKTLPIEQWSDPAAESVRDAAIAALESGQVLFFPQLGFPLLPSERSLLSPALSGGRAKNISLDPSGKLENARLARDERALLPPMMQRFADVVEALLRQLFPSYGPKLERARTSFRPVEIAGRPSARIRDDTLLHIDTFPSRPLHGRRILRLFCNIHPGGVPRVWNVGETFPAMAAQLLPQVQEPMALKARFLAAIGATRGVRSDYDSLMLGLHDRAKLDAEYQSCTPTTRVQFPSGSTWLCFTDQVMHAVLSGQFMLEQTFHLDVDAMAEPERAPIKVLEAMKGRRLA